MPWENLLTIGSALASLLVVLLLALLTLRWMGRTMAPQGGGGRHIRVVERVMVAQDKYLLLVSVGGKFMLIGMAGHSVTKLADLDELPPQEPGSSSPAFSQVLRETLGKAWPGKQKGEEHGGE